MVAQHHSTASGNGPNVIPEPCVDVDTTPEIDCAS